MIVSNVVLIFRMSKRSKVAYAGMDGDEPAFLKAFKKRVGYQETEPEEEMKVWATIKIHFNKNCIQS